MALTIGIIGLPQSGKTTLFNALTKAGAPISGYATSTVQANMAVVQVPDARLEPLAEIFKPKKVTYATVGPKDPVTGKRLAVTVDRYVYFKGGKVATVDLGNPVGVDNVDAFRMISESFRWG